MDHFVALFSIGHNFSCSKDTFKLVNITPSLFEKFGQDDTPVYHIQSGWGEGGHGDGGREVRKKRTLASPAKEERRLESLTDAVVC